MKEKETPVEMGNNDYSVKTLLAPEIKIIATDIETFKKLEEQSKFFPDYIGYQIESIEWSLAGYRYTLKDTQQEELYFPDINNIQIADGDVMVYTPYGFFKWYRSRLYADSPLKVKITNVRLSAEIEDVNRK